VDAEHVHGKLLDGKPGGFFLFFLRPPLEIPDDGTKLLLVQRIALPPEALPVQVADQGKVRMVGHRVHAVAHFQVIQDFQVGRVVEEGFVSVGVLADVLHQLLIDRLIRPLHDLRGQNGIYVDGFIAFCGIPAKVQAVHGQGTLLGIQALDADPVFRDLAFSVPVLDLQPFSLVDGSENVTADIVHRNAPLL
jgi:hypothetical protein